MASLGFIFYLAFSEKSEARFRMGHFSCNTAGSLASSSSDAGAERRITGIETDEQLGDVFGSSSQWRRLFLHLTHSGDAQCASNVTS